MERKSHVKFMILTKVNIRFVYDYEKLSTNPADSLEKTIRLPNEIGEGWGITNTKNELIISDGSDKLFFIEPLENEFKVKRYVEVKDSTTDRVYDNLNELEYAYDYVFSNIWFSNVILIIDPKTGKVVR
jgi:glutamine cyclotransferase